MVKPTIKEKRTAVLSCTAWEARDLETVRGVVDAVWPEGDNAEKGDDRSGLIRNCQGSISISRCSRRAL